MNEEMDDVYPRVMEVIRHAVEADEQNDTAFATQIMTAVVEEFPGLPIAHSYLGWVLSRDGRHREAIEHGRVGVQLAPKSEKSSLLLFRVLWSAEQREQAFDEMKRFMAVGHSDEYDLMLKEWQQEADKGSGAE
jgi:predicted Zn-dependent protease